MLFSFDNTYAQLPEAFSRPATPTAVGNPSLIAINRDLADALQFDADQLESEQGLAVLSGNQVPPGADPVAMAYSGHQFAGFSPQLGDGRAILLGEVLDRHGVRYDIQLKGSGPTPFSRRGDGRSALGPVLREYILSEAMFALGVPTTRALAAVATGEQVVRNGPEPGGVFTRVARSHLRIGTFQWFQARQDTDNLRVLADYAIQRHDPAAAEQDQPYLHLLEGVIRRQAQLVAHWMQLGFIHGVMNTDNMSISGETIDYGPCAFMDTFHPAKKFSSIDHQGRYAFANQGPIALWNLSRLAEAMLPLLADDQQQAIEIAQNALESFPDLHSDALQSRFCAKIGLSQFQDNDWELVQSLTNLMTEGEADFTLVFRHLAGVLEHGDTAPVTRLFQQAQPMEQWLAKWQQRMQQEDQHQALALMRRSNPIVIPRNHQVEAAIQAAYGGDYEPFRQLNEILRDPWQDRPDMADFEEAPEPHEVVQATFCGT